MGIPFEELSYLVAGINHFAWFLELKRHGKDVYPLLKEKLNDPAVYADPQSHYGGPDIVRAEVCKAFGYYVTESSGHIASYTLISARNGNDETVRDKYRRAYQSNAKLWMSRTTIKTIYWRSSCGRIIKFPLGHSTEFGSIIIHHAIETGEPAVIYGDVEK